MVDMALPAARMQAPGKIDRIETFVLRAPIATPVRTSFGVMRDRPALLIRITDRDGAFGWGEIWCNFPACGAAHRARLVETVFAPLLEGVLPDDIATARVELERRTRILAIQSGEAGPFAQVIAGIDCALADFAARRQGLPLWRYLGGEGGAEIPVYASGINPDGAAAEVERQLAAGFRAFKIKVGFDADADLANLRAARAAIGPQLALMADANQGWEPDTARQALAAFEPVGLGWIEEPLAADSSPEVWRDLRLATGIPLAAGENIRGEVEFGAMVASGLFEIIQPDCAKWGGVSGCLAVGRSAVRAGLRYCPHYLGAGIGLAASAHLLAAAGGDGLLEVDINDNPLRSELAPWACRPVEGRVRLPDEAGIGILPDPAMLARFSG